VLAVAAHHDLQEHHMDVKSACFEWRACRGGLRVSATWFHDKREGRDGL
jgi:hypothetical protein